MANRNRTLEHLYSNKIDNNIFLAGDTHQNWVSDLAWLGTKPYDQASGRGAIGIELGGTAVSSTGQKGPIEPVAGDAARGMIRRNEELAWQEGYYRGYFHLTVTAEKATAQYYGNVDLVTASRLLNSVQPVVLTWLRRLSQCRHPQRMGHSAGQFHHLCWRQPSPTAAWWWYSRVRGVEGRQRQTYKLDIGYEQREVGSNWVR